MISGTERASSRELEIPDHMLGWERYVLAAILAAAATTYTWALSENGWANAYYSAAVQAGLHDFTSFFFGSADWGNSITVDKPPLSLWVMGLSVRLFGLNTWGLLLPQVLMTLGSTFIIHRIIRRSFPAAVALLAAGVFASTPITLLLARYNNPDPLMVLLMLGALLAGLQAASGGRSRFLYISVLLLALGFLTKQLQAFLVLPAIACVFLVYARRTRAVRILSMALAGLGLTAGSLVWPLIVDLTPAESRPYVGGSSSNSMLELTLGYNGLDRVLQHEDPSTALIPEAMRSLETDAGFFRLLNANYGQEIGWLLLPAVLSCIAIAVKLLTGSYTRSGAIVASASVIWMATTFLVLSFMGNSFHSYYTASLAPPLALCIGLGFDAALSSRDSWRCRVGVAFTLVASSIFGHAMWQLSDSYPEWLGRILLTIGLLSGAMALVPPPRPWMRRAAVWTGCLSLLAGPLFCSTLTLATPQEGSNPLSGRVTRNHNSLSSFMAGIKNGSFPWAAGLALGNRPGEVLSQLLEGASPTCSWTAATYPGQTAAQFQLETDRPIMPLGGFAATDPSPTLTQFQELVADGRVCYLIVQPEQLAVPGNSADMLAINQWVQQRFEPELIDGNTVYRLQPQ